MFYKYNVRRRLRVFKRVYVLNIIMRMTYMYRQIFLISLRVTMNIINSIYLYICVYVDVSIYTSGLSHFRERN